MDLTIQITLSMKFCRGCRQLEGVACWNPTKCRHLKLRARFQVDRGAQLLECCHE